MLMYQIFFFFKISKFQIFIIFLPSDDVEISPFNPLILPASMIIVVNFYKFVFFFFENKEKMGRKKRLLVNQSLQRFNIEYD